MGLDFTDLSACVAFVLSRAAFTTAQEATTLLEISAGRSPDDPDVIIYRPYAVLASLFATHWNAYKRLRGASGAELEYNSAADAELAFRALQGQVDDSLGTVDIPPSWRSSTGTVKAGW